MRYRFQLALALTRRLPCLSPLPPLRLDCTHPRNLEAELRLSHRGERAAEASIPASRYSSLEEPQPVVRQVSRLLRQIPTRRYRQYTVYLAIQLAKISGFSPIIATASPRNNEFLKALGATHIIDRSLPLSSLAANVSAITKESLSIIYDTVGYPDTQNASYDILAPGGTFLTILSPAVKNVVPEKEIIAPYGTPHLPSHKEFGIELWQQIYTLLESGEFKVRVRSFASKA